MQIYLYAKSGHTIGLEQTKKCSAFANALKEFNPILCTSDFRAGAFAKDLLGVKKYVNIDVIRNLHNIMQRRDILIFDTDETNDIMNEGLNEYCSLVFNLNDIKEPIVDTSVYKNSSDEKIEKTIFFGDDDYYNQFIRLVENTGKFNMSLLMGHYFFLGNEKIFKNHFNTIIDEEEYVETIINTKYLLTSSLQSALESFSSGNKPVLFKREDKNYDENLIKEINIPVIEESQLDKIINEFEEIIKNYPELNSFEFANIDDIKSQIENKINNFKELIKA